MTVTAQQVFNMACTLIDEVSETGSVVLDNPKYYQTRAQTILTQLQAELLPLSVTPVVIGDLSQNLLLNDKDSLLILPYGLAAHLLLNDDSNVNTVSFFNNRYDELKRTRKTTKQDITDNYGVLGGMT